MAFIPYVNMGQRATFRYDPLASYLIYATPASTFPQLGMTQAWQDVSNQIRGNGVAQTPYTINVTGSNAVSTTGQFLQEGYRNVTRVDLTGAMFVNNNTTMHLGANLFTIEAYVRYETAGAMIYSDYTGGNVPQSALYWIIGTSNMTFYVDFGSSGETAVITIASITLNAGQWYHLVLQRSATNVWQIFQDGVLRGVNTSFSSNPNVPTTTNVCVGNYTSGGGTPISSNSKEFQDYRIYKGIAKYSSSFTTVGTTYFTPPSPMIIAP